MTFPSIADIGAQMPVPGPISSEDTIHSRFSVLYYRTNKLMYEMGIGPPCPPCVKERWVFLAL